MRSDELENYEAATELTLFKEYRDVFAMFKYAVETDQRFYLCNSVEVETKLTPAGQTYFEVVVDDAWIWDNHRPARFIRNARLRMFRWRSWHTLPVRNLVPSPNVSRSKVFV